MQSNERVTVAQRREFITACLEKLGLPRDAAATCGRLMADAEAQGSDGHGVIRLMPYARRIRAGGMNLMPDIRVVKEKAAMALIDGDNGMGHLAGGIGGGDEGPACQVWRFDQEEWH